MCETIRKSLESVQTWVEQNNYTGYDPGDGLTSFLRPLTFDNVFAERVLQQLVWKSPINLRPWLGCATRVNKGSWIHGVGLSAFLPGLRRDGPTEKGNACLDWLDRQRKRIIMAIAGEITLILLPGVGA